MSVKEFCDLDATFIKVIFIRLPNEFMGQMRDQMRDRMRSRMRSRDAIPDELRNLRIESLKRETMGLLLFVRNSVEIFEAPISISPSMD